MTTESGLPRTVDALTADWLTAALSTRCPDIRVTNLAVDNILWGTSTKVLVTAEYIGEGERPPPKLCIKGEFDERVRRDLGGVSITGTQVEADFFNDLAPRLGVPLPRHWYGGSEPGMGILVLDNLTALGARFGTPTEPWSIELVAAGLEVLAALHGSTWNRLPWDVPWMKLGSPVVRTYHEFLVSKGHWDKHFTDPASFRLPPLLQDPERCLRALRNLWKHDDAVATCVIHGDAHLGNTCVDADGHPFFIDWAAPCVSCWAFDVSYFLAGSLTVADRRASEVDLLRHYLEALAARGGPSLAFKQAWDDYRRHHMHGMVWATLPPTLQARDCVDAMSERYVAAVMDHDSLALLEQTAAASPIAR